MSVVPLPPKQIVAGEPALAVGVVFTVIATVAVAEHPLVVPVTVYVVVADGVAFGFAIEGLLNPVVGNHAYVVPPLAVNGVEVPEQIVAVPLADTDGIGLTVTVTTCVEEHIPVVPVTVYVVVVVGFATGFAIDGLLNPVVGNHE